MSIFSRSIRLGSFISFILIIVTVVSSTAQFQNSESFENGMGIWNFGGFDCTLVGNRNLDPPGQYCIGIRDNSGSSSSLISDVLDLSAYHRADISFLFLPQSMEQREDFMFEYSSNGGHSYELIKSWVSGDDFQNGVLQDESFSFEREFSSQSVFRWRCDASSNYDIVFLDRVVLDIRSSNIVGFDCPNQNANIGDACGIQGTIDANCQCIEPDPSDCSQYDFTGLVLLGTYDGLDYYRSTTGNYFDNTRGVYRDQAYAEASSRGASLPKIKDAETDAFLRSLVGNQEKVWIGLTDLALEGDYRWEDGTQATYTNWAANQPNKYISTRNFYDFAYSGEQGWVNINSYYATAHRIFTFPTCQDDPIVNPCRYDLRNMLSLGSHEGIDYYRFVSPTPYNGLLISQAKAEAEQRGGLLPIINDSSTYGFLRSVMYGQGSYWIDLSDADNEGVYTWGDNSPLTFSRWAYRQPSSHSSVRESADYVMVTSSGWVNVAEHSGRAELIIGFVSDCSPNYDCPDISADYNDPCDDNNSNTENDVVNTDCTCAGTLIQMKDCQALDANIGDPCDDNNTNTTGDAISADCQCIGTIVSAYDCPSLSANIGDLCDDNNPLTLDDYIGANCQCTGSLIAELFSCYTLSDVEDFESGYGDLWQSGGSDVRLVNTPGVWYALETINPHRLPEGPLDNSKVVRIRDNSGSRSSLVSQVIDMSSADNIRVEFSFVPQSMEIGEDFLLEYSLDQGLTWHVAGQWTSGTDFTNNVRYYERIDLSARFSGTTVLRFRCDASSNYDRIYLDNIKILNCDGLIEVNEEVANHDPLDIKSQSFDYKNDMLGSRVSSSANPLRVYPNPSQHILYIEGLSDSNYDIYNGLGLLVAKSLTSDEIDISNFQNGYYILKTKQGETIRFIKI